VVIRGGGGPEAPGAVPELKVEIGNRRFRLSRSNGEKERKQEGESGKWQAGKGK